MKRLRFRDGALSMLAALMVLAAAPAATAQPGQHDHVMQTLAEAKWGPAPPFLPPGAEIALLAGNPMAAEPYAVRLKFPAGYAIPAHSHPTDENVTVISGAVFMGMGDRLDRSAGRRLGVGGFAMMPAGQNHFAYTKEPTTIVLHGIGPVVFRYVNPADDPQAGKPASGAKQ